MSKKYGPEHRAERQKALDRTGGRCEVTGSTEAPQAHHIVPKLINGPDLASNYVILTKAFHDYLHHICDTRDAPLVGKRLYLANFIKKHILDERKTEQAKKQLEEVDNKLMGTYIANMLNKLTDDYKEVIFLTILSNFKTIRDVTIMNTRLSIENAMLKERLGTMDK